MKKTITINAINDMYKWSKGDLFDAYDKPSMRKIESWRCIQDKVTHAHGRDLAVRSRNCHMYTAIWRTDTKFYIEYPNRTEEYEIINGVA